MTIPRQLAPTVGPAHGGFEFLKGSFEGLKGYAVGRMTKSRRGKLYIDDANWGPDAGSIEYGYRVPFGGIHVFIGKIGEPGPEPDLCADLIETAQHARPARARPAVKHAFVGCIMEGSLINLDLVMRRPPALTASRPQMSQTRCINFKMAGSWVVPMVTVFRTRLSRRAGLESSWPVRSLFRTLLLERETRCLRRLRC